MTSAAGSVDVAAIAGAAIDRSDGGGTGATSLPAAEVVRADVGLEVVELPDDGLRVALTATAPAHPRALAEELLLADDGDTRAGEQDTALERRDRKADALRVIEKSLP